MATSRSGLLRFLVGFLPPVSTETEDFDAELELLGVQGLPPGLGAWPECPACGVKGVQEAPEPVKGLLDLGWATSEPGERLCWACTAQEEVSQAGVQDLLYRLGLPKDLDGPCTLIVVGTLRWDCFQDYWTGHDECDVEFEPSDG
jgi:hypothetical protein